jgi:5'-deoxynucleotidase YfbR-like HD superfamily hydrolase
MSEEFKKAQLSRRAGKVRRFHTYQMIAPQDVAQHSFNVANLVRIMGGDSDTILAALCHDMGEWATGDIPSPVKRGMTEEGRRFLNNLEGAGAGACGGWPCNFGVDHGLIKVADNLEGLITAMEELDRGNKDMLDCLDKYAEYLSNQCHHPLVAHYLNIYNAKR